MPSLSIMVKPASSRCTFACEYCFYRDVSLNRAVADRGIMSRSTSRALIEKSLDFAASDPVSFIFQGGEPTLAGIDFFKGFIDDVNALNTRGSAVYYSLQTNGALIDGEWARFLRQNDITVGLSLDGDYAANACRKSADGKSTFYKTLAAAETLDSAGVRFDVLAVLTSLSAGRGGELYSFFRSQGFERLHFIPALRPLKSRGDESLYMSAADYAAFLTEAFRLYVRDLRRGRNVSVRRFDNWLRLYRGLPAEQCGMNGVCSRQFVAEANGDIFPCDFYCTDEYLLGNINECGFSELAFSRRAIEFIESSADVSERCRKCAYFRICRAGGCRRERESEDFCEAYRAFFDSCLPLFEELCK